MDRRTFVSLSAVAGAGLACGRNADDQVQFLVRTPKLDVDGMLELTRVPGVAVAGVVDGRPVEFYNGVQRAGDPGPLRPAHPSRRIVVESGLCLGRA